MYNTILVEKRTNLNQKKTKVVNSTSSSDKDILYSLVDKAYYVDGIYHKIDNNLCMDSTDF
jgi:hypothetical protein